MNYTRNSYLETAECALCGGEGAIPSYPGFDACPVCAERAESAYQFKQCTGSTTSVLGTFSQETCDAA